MFVAITGLNTCTYTQKTHANLHAHTYAHTRARYGGGIAINVVNLYPQCVYVTSLIGLVAVAYAAHCERRSHSIQIPSHNIINTKPRNVPIRLAAWRIRTLAGLGLAAGPILLMLGPVGFPLSVPTPSPFALTQTHTRKHTHRHTHTPTHSGPRYYY